MKIKCQMNGITDKVSIYTTIGHHGFREALSNTVFQYESFKDNLYTVD